MADYVGQPLLVIDCALHLFDPTVRVTYTWDMPGVELRRTQSEAGRADRVSKFRWDAKRRLLLTEMEGVGEAHFDVLASGELTTTVHADGVRMRARYSSSGDRMIARLELDRGQGWVPHNKYVLMRVNSHSLARAPELARELGGEFSYLSSLAEANLRDGRDAGIPADW